MITKTDSRGVQNGKELVRLAFKSTDSKPTTGIMNGSTGIEVNTGKQYVYDEESGEWTEIASSGGGGGGSGDFFTQYNVEVKVTEYSVSKPPLFLEGLVLGGYENLDDGVTLTLDALSVTAEFNDEQIANIPVLVGNLNTSIVNFAINIDGGAGDITEITTDGNVTYDSEEQFFAVTGDGKIFVKLNIE